MSAGDDLARQEAALQHLSQGHLRGGDAEYLPLVLKAEPVAGAFAVSKFSLYEQVRKQTFPITPIRLGTALRFRTSDVLRELGLDAGGAPEPVGPGDAA